MYSLCENIVDMSCSMMNLENWIWGNKNSCQVFSISLVQHVLSRLSTFYISEEQVSLFFIALFLSVLNPMDDFLYRWMTFSLCRWITFFFRIDLQRMRFWVN